MAGDVALPKCEQYIGTDQYSNKVLLSTNTVRCNLSMLDWLINIYGLTNIP